MSTSMYLDDLADRITAARDIRTEAEQRIALAVLRALAHGAPVPPAALADLLPGDDARLASKVLQRPGVFRDNDQQIIGLLGLSVVELGNHRLDFGHGDLSAWCAWDTLFLPGLLGAAAAVTSRCPQTGAPISLTVTAAGPIDLDPNTSVLTLRDPQAKFDEDVISNFCHDIHFLATPEAAAEWTAEHPGTFVMSLQDGFRLAQMTNAATFGAALGHPSPTWEI